MKKIVLMLLLLVVSMSGVMAAQSIDLPQEQTVQSLVIGGILIITAFATQALKKVVELNGIWYQVFSIIVAIGLTFLSWYLKLEPFGTINLWYQVLMAGLGMGLISNRSYDIGKILLRKVGINIGSDFSFQDYTGYFEEHSPEGMGQFRVFYDHGKASITPEQPIKYTDVKIN